MLLTSFPWAFVPLKTLLETKQDDLCKQNLEASSDRCSALLRDIFGPLEEDVKQGIYSKPGGHHQFIQKTEELKAKYYQEPRKGIQVSLVLCINFKKLLERLLSKSSEDRKKVFIL